MIDDNRERSDDGTYVETVTPEDVLALFTDAEPRTAIEVADELGIARRTALNKLNELAEQDRIQRKKVGGRAVIWWVSGDDS
jgi:predicted ArsR family transcriptional regulator